MDVRITHVRHLEQFRRLLLDSQHYASMLHFGGQVSGQTQMPGTGTPKIHTHTHSVISGTMPLCSRWTIRL